MAVYIVQAVRTWVREIVDGWNAWWRGWVMWVWLIFIGFLAVKDDEEEEDFRSLKEVPVREEEDFRSLKEVPVQEEEDFRSLKEVPVHEEEVVSAPKRILEEVPTPGGRLELLIEEPEEPKQEEPLDDGFLGNEDVKEGDGSWPRGGIAQEGNLVRYKAFEHLDSPQLEDANIEVKKVQKEALFSSRKDAKEVSPLRKEVFPSQREKNEVFPAQRDKKELSPALQDVVTALSKVEEKEKKVFEEEESFDDQIDDPSKDVVWRNLLEKYASEAQQKERDRDDPSFEEDTSQGEIAATVEEIVEKYAKRYGDSDEEHDESKDLSAEEFTSRVGKKLEEYLAQVEEPSDDDDNLSDEDYPVEVRTNKIMPDIMEIDTEGDDLKAYLEGPIDGDERIFILIEDEELGKNGREPQNDFRGFRLEKINEGEEPETENEYKEMEEKEQETRVAVNESARAFQDEFLLKDEDFKPKEKGHFFDRNVSYIDDEEGFFEHEKGNFQKHSEKEKDKQELQEIEEALRIEEKDMLPKEEPRDGEQGHREDSCYGKEAVVSREEKETESATIEEEEADETDLPAKKPQVFKDQGFNAFVTIIGCSEDYYDEGEIPNDEGEIPNEKEVGYDIDDKFVEEEQEEEGFWEEKEEEPIFQRDLKEEGPMWEEKEKETDLRGDAEKETCFQKGVEVEEEKEETGKEEKEEEEEEEEEEVEEGEEEVEEFWKDKEEEEEEEENFWKDKEEEEEEENYWKGREKDFGGITEKESAVQDSLLQDEGGEAEVIEREEILEYEVMESEVPKEKEWDIMTEVMSEISDADQFGHESVTDIAELDMKIEKETACEEYEVPSMGVVEVEEKDDGEHEVVVEMDDDSMVMKKHEKAHENFEFQLRSVAAFEQAEREDEVISGLNEALPKLDSARADEVFEVPAMSVVEVEHNRGIEDETVGELDYEKLKRDKSAEAEESFELPRQSIAAVQGESGIKQEFIEEMEDGIEGSCEEATEVFEAEAKSVAEVEEREKMVAEVVREIDPLKLPISKTKYIKCEDSGKIVAKVEVREKLKGDEIMGRMEDFQLEVDFVEEYIQHTDPDPTLMATMDEVEVLEMKETKKEEAKPKKDSEKPAEGPAVPKRAKKSEEEKTTPTKTWKRKEAETKEVNKEEKIQPKKIWKKKEVVDSKDELKNVFGKITKMNIYGEKSVEPAKPSKKPIKKLDKPKDEPKAPGSKVPTKKSGEPKKEIPPEESRVEPEKAIKKWSKKEEVRVQPKETPSKTAPSRSKKKETKEKPEEEPKKTIQTSPKEKDTETEVDFWANLGEDDAVEDKTDFWKDTAKNEAEAEADDGEDFWAAMGADDNVPVKPKRPSWVEEVVSEKKFKADDQEVPTGEKDFLKKEDEYDADLLTKGEDEEDEIDEELKGLLVPKTEADKRSGSKLATLTGIEDILDLKMKRKSPVPSKDSKVENWLRTSDKTKSPHVSHLSEVEDLLVPKEPRNLSKTSDAKDEGIRQPDKALHKYMSMGTKLTAQEEEELKAYIAEEKKEVKDMDLDQYLALSDDLTEQEKQELDAYRKEKEEIHQARMKELEKYLDMPDGLTEEEKWELEEYLSNKEPAEDSAMDTDDRFLSMPLGETDEMMDVEYEEEEEEEEDEGNFQTDEEYRQYIRERYLRQLDLEYMRLAEEEYRYDEYGEYDEDYDYEEYEDDEYELQDEEMESEDLGTAVKPKGVPKMVDEAVSTDAVEEKTPEAKKKSGLFKLRKEGSKENLESKKFFHFGGFGNKKKKMGSRASSEDSGENQGTQVGLGLKAEGSPKAPVAPRRKKKGLADEEDAKTGLAGRSPLLKKARRKIVAPNSQKSLGTTAEKQLPILQESFEEAGEKQDLMGEKENEHPASTTSPVRINRPPTHQSKSSQHTPCRQLPHHRTQHHHNQHPYNPGSHVTTEGEGYTEIGRFYNLLTIGDPRFGGDAVKEGCKSTSSENLHSYDCQENNQERVRLKKVLVNEEDPKAPKPTVRLKESMKCVQESGSSLVTEFDSAQAEFNCGVPNPHQVVNDVLECYKTEFHEEDISDSCLGIVKTHIIHEDLGNKSWENNIDSTDNCDIMSELHTNTKETPEITCTNINGKGDSKDIYRLSHEVRDRLRAMQEEGKQFSQSLIRKDDGCTDVYGSDQGMLGTCRDQLKVTDVDDNCTCSAEDLHKLSVQNETVYGETAKAVHRNEVQKSPEVLDHCRVMGTSVIESLRQMNENNQAHDQPTPTVTAAMKTNKTNKPVTNELMCDHDESGDDENPRNKSNRMPEAWQGDSSCGQEKICAAGGYCRLGCTNTSESAADTLIREPTMVNTASSRENCLCNNVSNEKRSYSASANENCICGSVINPKQELSYNDRASCDIRTSKQTCSLTCRRKSNCAVSLQDHRPDPSVNISVCNSLRNTDSSSDRACTSETTQTNTNLKLAGSATAAIPFQETSRAGRCSGIREVKNIPEYEEEKTWHARTAHVLYDCVNAYTVKVNLEEEATKLTKSCGFGRKMSDMEDTETPVSSKGKADSLVPDSLEFDSNTTPLISRDLQDQALSLQELIDAELTNRLSPQDSLEVTVPLKDGQADLESLISSDSIEDELRIKKEGADQFISLDSVESVNIDVTNSNTLSLNLDDLAKVEVESGIEVLSPNKVNADDMSLPSGCHDSLESSSDLPGSPSPSTPDPISPTSAQQTFSHQTLVPTDDLGLYSSVDKSNSSSAEDSTAATTIIPQTEDLLGLDSSFTNMSYSVQTISNSSLEENLLESFSSVPSTFQKQGTLEGYEEGYEAFDAMEDNVTEVYMEDEKGTGTEPTRQIHVVTRNTDLPRSYSIVSEGIGAEEEFGMDCNFVVTEESDQLTNLDGSRELEISKDIDQILVDNDAVKADKEELPNVAEEDLDSRDILASLVCKEELKSIKDKIYPESAENGGETKESGVAEDLQIKELEIVENHANEKSATEVKGLDIFSENHEPWVEPEIEEVEIATEIETTKTAGDDDVLTVDLLNAENAMNSGRVKIVVTEENGDMINDGCDLRRASDGELVIVEDSFKPSNPDDQMDLNLTQDFGGQSGAEVRLIQDSEETKSSETQHVQPSQNSKDLFNSETELIQDSQETCNAEAILELVIVEDTDKVKTETEISVDEKTILNRHEDIAQKRQTSINSIGNEKPADTSADTPKEGLPEVTSDQQRKPDHEKVEDLTSTKPEPPEAASDPARQDLVDANHTLTSDNSSSMPGKDVSLNSTVLSTEQTHAGVGDDLLTTNEAPKTNTNMGKKTYDDDEEEGFFGNEDDDDVPSSKLKKDEEDDEGLREDDEEDEEAARTAFLMKMADGYEGEEREAVEAFIRSKLEQEKVDKADDEENKATENGDDEGEKKKKKKKRSEGGEKKSRKKKKKSDDKIPEDVEEGRSAASSTSSSSSSSSSSSTASYSSGAEESENGDGVRKVDLDLVDPQYSEEIESEINYDEAALREESTSEREEDAEYEPSHSLTNGHHTDAHGYTNGHHVPSSDECPDEELMNVNVKKLTSAYLHSASHDDSGRSSGSDGRTHVSKEEIVRPSVSIHQLMGAYTSPTKTSSKPEPLRIDKELPPEGTLHSRLNAYSAVAQNHKPVTSKEEINVGVSFSSLKSAYVQSANKSRPPSQGSDKDCNGLSSPLKEEVNLNVSLTQLRETYCNTARSSSARDDVTSTSSSASKTSPVVSTGVKIKDLTRSWSDLSQAGRDKMATPCSSSAISCDQHIFSRVSVKELRRSYTDLTRITTTASTAEDRVEKRGRENDTDSFSVSVRDLRASYGDLSRLADSPPIPVGRFRTPSPSPRSRSFGVMSRSTSHQNLGPGQQQPLSLPTCNSFSTYSTSSSNSLKNSHKSCEPGQPLQLSSRASSMVELGGRRSKEVGVGVAEASRGGLKEPIYTGVSVAQLKRSYCDLTRVQAPSPNPPKTPDLQWVEGSVQRMCAAFSTPPPPSPQPSFSPSQRRRFITGVSVAQMEAKKEKRAAYNRDELYEKHVGPRVRSFDASKMKSKFEKPKDPFPLYSLLDQYDNAPSQLSSDCRMCGKQVFQMEKIVAEKATWHKNCFRCKECNKNLTLETYQSHEGALYCKPHFKELFRPKAVIEDEATARKDRTSDKPDYGLEELQTNVREKFAMFETASKDDEETKLEPVSVRRSQSLLNRVARFQRGESGEEYGVENSELGEYEDDEDDEEVEDEEEEEIDDENADPDIVRPKKKKKERPMSIGNMGDLKAAWETKNRRAEMAQNRKEELAKFRQMLCAGKNLTLKEMFESGAVDGEKMDKAIVREEIKIDGKRAASSLKEKFEQGQPFILEDEENRGRKANGEREEVEEIFKEAETAHKARNIFKQIDSHVTKEGLPVMRSQSFAQGTRENRLSKDMSQHCLYSRPENQSAEVIKAHEEVDDFHVETSDLASRFKFFATYEDRLKEESKKNRKVFRFSPPRDGTVKVEEDLMALRPKRCMAINCAVCRLRGLGGEDQEIGRDPNLIRCSDNYQDDVDCKNTRNVLAMFKKMELQACEDGDEGPKPLKRFTPPLDGEYDDEDEYSDEEYSDEEYSDEEDEDEEEDSEGGRKSKYQDEVLEMAKQARKKSPQSAKKAASLRAKFERWETDQNEVNIPKDDDEECMPSIDTAKNLKAMFETKAQEVLLPKVQQPKVKVNRFVGGGGDTCIVCDKTVYAMEKLELQGKILHKSCFRCCKCNTKLSMGSFSMGGDRMYCTTHYKQLFAEKGTYEVFSPNGTGKWARKIEATPNNEETEPKSNS